MKSIEILGLSKIWIDESLRNLEKYLSGKRTVIVTDVNVDRYYREQFQGFDVVVIPTGEEIKNLATVGDIYERFLDLDVDRSCLIVGIGGGIVCDITGFAASTYMRGLPFGFVSSSLLAQVDAGIGGKNGVNFRGYKNLIGVFNQPHFIICDLEMLKTLPKNELRCGFAEVVKHALIGSAALFTFLEERFNDALNLDMAVLEKVVADSVTIKAGIVKQDERERGERRKLNFGHTLGHALEKITGISHGQAVGIGMATAANLSVSRGFLLEREADRIKNLLRNFGLPIELAIEKDRLLEAIKKDKKREGENIHFVWLDGIGRARVEPVSMVELGAMLDDLR